MDVAYVAEIINSIGVVVDSDTAVVSAAAVVVVVDDCLSIGLSVSSWRERGGEGGKKRQNRSDFPSSRAEREAREIRRP